MNLLDLKHAARALARTRLATAAATVSLALGIGGATVIFSVTDAIVLRPLPYPEAERLVRVQVIVNDDAGRVGDAAAPADFLDWQRQARTLDLLGATFASGMSLVDGTEPEQARVQSVSGTFFTILGVRAELGRTLLPSDDAADARLAVVSHDLWQRRYGGDRAILGRAVTLGGRPATIVGVMPAGFTYETPTDVWLLGVRGIPDGTPVPGDLRAVRDAHFLPVVGRLAAGVSRAAAQAEMSAIAADLAARYPATNAGVGVRLVPLAAAIVGDTPRVLLLLVGAVVLLLAVAAVNVANLLLARAGTRTRELALRHTLGASRGQIVRLQLTESVLLALAGGALGVVVAAWGIEALVAFAPADLPRAGEIALDWRALVAALVVSIVTGLVFGAWPAVVAARPDVAQALTPHARGTARKDERGRQTILVGIELAMAQALLVGAGLLAASFIRLGAVEPGFDARGVLLADVALPAAIAKPPERKAGFVAAVEARLAALPGVRVAAVALTPPMAGAINRGVSVEGRQDPPPPADSSMDFYTVTPGYFRALGIRVLRGRSFEKSDTATSQPVAIVNEAFAREYFPGEDPLGRRIGFGRRDSDRYWPTIVGIVADVRQRRLTSSAGPQAFVPASQDREPWNLLSLVVKSDGDPLRLASSVRRAVLEVDPTQPVSDIRSLSQALARSTATRRFTLLLVSGFAAAALLLAAVGTFGVMSHAVVSRTREIGIRLALGAHPWQVVRPILSASARVAVIASAAGLTAGALAGRAAESLLFEVTPADGRTLAVAATALVGVALLASYLPVRRALASDPTRSLREE